MTKRVVRVKATTDVASAPLDLHLLGHFTKAGFGSLQKYRKGRKESE